MVYKKRLNLFAYEVKAVRRSELLAYAAAFHHPMEPRQGIFPVNSFERSNPHFSTAQLDAQMSLIRICNTRGARSFTERAGVLLQRLTTEFSLSAALRIRNVNNATGTKYTQDVHKYQIAPMLFRGSTLQPSASLISARVRLVPK
jgi:hypothetical protein